jgi:hypothetical protein
MPTLRAKGKIQRSEWSKIRGRYDAGDTIAQISRDYKCTAPAIRYIVKRTGALKEHAPALADTLPAASSHGAEHPSARRLAAIEANTARGLDGNLDAELRRRVSGDVAAFLVALDQAVIAPSSESVASLQDVTDRLMRSAARVRIDLERILDGYDRQPSTAHRTVASAARPHRA